MSHLPALNVDEIHSATEKMKRRVFDELIERRWNSKSSKATNPSPTRAEQQGAVGTNADELVANEYKEYEGYEDDLEKERVVPEFEDIVDSTHTIVFYMPKSLYKAEKVAYWTSQASNCWS